MRAIMSAAALSMLMASPAEAIRPDECEQQRALFPKEWNDVSNEKPLFFCWSHYSGAFKVTLGTADDKGRRLMSLVPLERNEAKAKQDTSKDVFRIWLDKEQSHRLQEGKYFATVVRQKESCWIRGASFIVDGAIPAKNSALTSAGAELRLANGVTLLAKFDGEFASHSSTYAGTGTLRYRW
jgi:hypothetical protein